MKKSQNRRMSVFVRYLLICMIILMCSLLLIALVSIFYINNTTDNYNEKIKTQCAYVSSNISQHIDNLKKQCDIPLYRNTVNHSLGYLQELKKSTTNDANLLAYQRNFAAVASLIHISNANVHSIYSYNSNLDCKIWESVNTAYPPVIDPSIWKEDVDAANGATLFLGAMHLSDRDHVFVVGRAIQDTMSNSSIGYFLIAEKMDVLQSMCNTMSLLDSQQYMIVSSDGTVISSNDSQQINTNLSDVIGNDGFKNLLVRSSGEVKINSHRFLYAVSPVESTDWHIINFVPKVDVASELYYTSSVLIGVVLVVFIAISAATVYQFYSSVISPVNSLIQSIRSSGMLFDAVEVDADEISFLNTSYDQLCYLIERLQNENYFITLRKKQLEIELLQAQINPHFLYNTLESIRMMAEIREDTEAAEMTLALSKILRYSIGTLDKITSIRDEIAIIQEYFFLQKIRLDNLESLQIDIPPDYYDVPIPKLSLQPLVENAIMHGLENVTTHGTIDISCTSNESFLTISVTDNGSGIKPEIVQTLEKRLLDDQDQLPGHIGIQNISRRIKLLYGIEYGLRIESTPGCGTTVYMDLPPQERRPNEDSNC